MHLAHISHMGLVTCCLSFTLSPRLPNPRPARGQAPHRGSVGERERERESESVCVCVRERESEREGERERERDGEGRRESV